MSRLRELFVCGRRAVPIRANPFATAGELTPEDIACAVAQSPEWDGRRYMTVLTAHYMNPAGVARAEPRFESVAWARNVGKLAKDGAAHGDQIRALPAGMFVWEDELQGLVREINDVQTELPPFTSGAPEIELTCSPTLDDADAGLVLEGFDVAQFDPGPGAGSVVGNSGTNREELVVAPVAASHSADDETTTIPTSGLVHRKHTKAQSARLVAQQLAKRLWKKDETLTQTEILQMPEFASLRKRYVDRKTIRGWIRDVDPRPVGTRRGRRKRRS